MNSKGDKERNELHNTIWKIANELRGSVDGWDFKQYVLGLLFYRFISENIENRVNYIEHEAGNSDFKYSELSDEKAITQKEEIIREKGMFILPSELFCNVRKRAKNDSDLNITLKNIFDNIENSAKGHESEEDVKGLFMDLDVNSEKLGSTVKERNEKLVKLIDTIGDLNLGNEEYKDNSIDTFGDAYEYLMTMYATNAGKSGGEFFTPQEVGELLARITLIGKKSVKKVYDPCCGSGGLLLKFAKILGKENVDFYGQEINLTTYNLCRINMFLHDINYHHFSIKRGDTLLNPMHKDDEPFEAIVSNPPYSIKWEGKSNPLLINDDRFSPAGVLAPESKADLAFTMHMLSCLSNDGTAAIVEFPGVLYRGGAEQKIRKYLVDNNFVDTVIALPSDLFFGTSIATCILVLKKNKIENKVQFIDASKEFVRSTNKNKLSDENIENILNLIINKEDVDYKSILVDSKDIADNDYNLSVSTYLEKEDLKEEINIKELNKNLDEIVEKENKLRTEINKIISDIEDDYE